MLVELTVENFRSIRGAQTLSLVAAGDKERRSTHVISSSAPATPDLLRVAVIYGANASGKSNLMRALMRLDQVVSGGSIMGKERRLGKLYEPYRGDESSSGVPTRFNAVFVENNVRFEYQVSYNSERIIDEHLYAFPEGRPQRWFSRAFLDGEEKISYGSSLRGPKKLWEAAVASDIPFLTTAAALKSDQLQVPYSWFNKGLGYFLNPFFIKEDLTAAHCYADPEMKDRVYELICKSDLGVSGISIERVPLDFDGLPPEFAESFRSIISKSGDDEALQVEEVSLEHTSKDGYSFSLKLKEESSGTNKIFSLAAPWVNALIEGKVLFIDELETNLHPMMVEFLVGMFLDPDVNVGGAQLIFTTHNTNVMSVMRRDQIWITEKGKDLVTRLTPFSDFGPRKSENLERSYLAGRYGGVPFTGRVFFGGGG